ncbi:MAG: SPOR domain-containing protein [Pseudomonadota bacterium]
MKTRAQPTIGAAARRSDVLRRTAALGAVLLLSACGTVEWVKARFVAPTASTPAESTSSPASQRATPAPAPAAEAPAPAPQRAPLPPATQPIAESAPLQSAPLPPPASAPQPLPAPTVAEPAPRAAPAAPPASGDLAAGRWAAQVGVFYVANSAEAVRARVAARLAQSGLSAESRATRVVKRDNKYFVVVGDAADRAAAEALASRVRAALKQDVVLFRR